MTKEEIIQEAREWAEEVWDERDLLDDDKSKPAMLNLAKSASAMGYSAGYQAASAKWVSVKERLPNEDEPVLVYGQVLNDIARVLGVKRRYRGDQDWKYTWESEDDYIFTQDDVTHWKPLDEPPMEEA
jgi:hypothetical protein